MKELMDKIPFNGYKTAGSVGLWIAGTAAFLMGIINIETYTMISGAAGFGAFVGLVHKYQKGELFTK